jgi:hypothetical protein
MGPQVLTKRAPLDVFLSRFSDSGRYRDFDRARSGTVLPGCRAEVSGHHDCQCQAAGTRGQCRPWLHHETSWAMKRRW